MNKAKVVILAGGKGTRIAEETEYRPKPMIKIGEKPILWHIMKIYAGYGYTDFVICLGYKGEMIKELFLNYKAMNSDFTITLGKRDQIMLHGDNSEDHWTVTLADTGLEALTGCRLKRVEHFIDSDIFMLTYGDGVADINIKELISFHLSHKKIGTVTGVHPPSRFGELTVGGRQVFEFTEKPNLNEGHISGGFFVFDRRIFNYVNGDENCRLEKEPLERLAKDGELMVYFHNGFWQCMDTVRDMNFLNNLWKQNNAPWKIWKD
ncbi:MAG: glucose-1-phosphate cytidylyltransferase [Nitrospiraceae bacterium]|nr:MAG: glucose-1-phosphate cytidylyltransferase [Nitrospiraceae bacterium]